MNIALVYFSQTGNTKKVAQSMAEAFLERGHSVNIMPWKDARIIDITECDVLGIGAPCFESQAPVPIKTFVSQLPSLKGKLSFVFATCGGAPGRVLYDLSRGLRKRKAKVIAGFTCHGEVRHPAPCLKGRLLDRPNDEDLEDARVFARAVAGHATAGQKKPIHGKSSNSLKPGWSFYHLVSFIAKPPLLRILLPKPSHVPSLCKQCGLCVRECPMSCISFKQNPESGNTCIRCFRCLTACPEKAFHVSWRYGNLVIWVLYNKLFSRLFGDLKPGERIY